jgi:N-acylneuraminate cytidylyltransferase
MINNETVLAIIPARGGSKAIPGKNLQPVAGKPLLAWTIEAASQSRYIDRTILSSNDLAIIETARANGCEAPFVRPDELARDDTPGVEPILHALSMLPPFDWVVMLQPTSPLRLASDIDGCIEFCVKQGGNAAVSVTTASENPYWMFTLDSHQLLEPVMPVDEVPPRRQDLPEVMVLNGAVYIARSQWLKQSRIFLTRETLGYRMPEERSLDIDVEQDLREADRALRLRRAS